MPSSSNMAARNSDVLLHSRGIHAFSVKFSWRQMPSGWALDGVVEAGDLHFKGDLPAVVDAGVPGLPAVGLEGQDCQDLKGVAHRQLVAAREVGGVAGRLP